MAQIDAAPETVTLRVAVDRFVTAYMAKNRVPGAVVVVIKDDKVIVAAGYGRQSNGVPMTAQVQVPIASLSKSFTALAVMQLVESGRVQLDAPVRDYLPDFVLADPRSAEITVRQLLDQTSGMSDKTFHEKSLPQPHTLEEAVARLHNAPLADAPGAKFHYHNPNFQVAARLVEVVSGEAFGDYLRAHIFASLGMDASTTVARLTDAPDVAKGHIRLYRFPAAVAEPYWYLDGSSGVVTTAEDLARWMLVQNNAGQLPGGARILSVAGLELTHTAANSDISGYALGWNDRRNEKDVREISHTGWMFTYTAKTILLPESGFGIAVIANKGLSLGSSDADMIVDGLIALIRGETPVVGPPIGLIVDVVLAALTIGAVALGTWRLRRARKWASYRVNYPNWRLALTALPGLAPITVLATLHPLISYLFGGRDGKFVQLFYLSAPLMVWLILASLFWIAVLATRGYRLVQARRDPGGFDGKS